MIFKIFSFWVFISFVSLMVISLTQTKELGFRTRVLYAFLWLIWIPIYILGFLFGLIRAFIKNSSLEESLEETFAMKIFRRVTDLW